MKPNKEGIWEWYDETGKKQLVSVINVGKEVDNCWLRVYYLGGYYNVHDNWVGTEDEEFGKAEWPDNWGNYVGDLDSVPIKETYGGVTEVYGDDI